MYCCLDLVGLFGLSVLLQLLVLILGCVWTALMVGIVLIVWIVWKDACGDSSRVHIDSVQDCSLVTNANIGFIMHETDERVILVHGLSTGGEVDYFAIPTNCIVERVYLNRQPRREPSAKKKSPKRRRRSSK